MAKPCTRPNTSEIAYRSNGHGLREVYNALVTCPNITSLDLDFVWGGCVAPSDPWQFDFRHGDRFPALKHLSLSGYEFGIPRAPSINRGTLRKLLTDFHMTTQWLLSTVNIVEDKGPLASYVAVDDFLERWSGDDRWQVSNLEEWIKAMDFAQLEELHLAQDEPTFYERMIDELHGLKSLSFTWSNTGSQVPQERIDFIRNMPPLESLSIIIGVPYYYEDGPKNRTQFPLSEILQVHGDTLQALSLKQWESEESNLRRPMLSTTDLDAIHKSCPHLVHLCLDIDRDESYGWPNETLSKMSSMETLKSLILRMEIGADMHIGQEGEYYFNPEGISGPGPFREPRMSLEVAKTLFQDLQSIKHGSAWEKVEFVVGDYEQKPYSGPIYIPSWEEGRARKFVCEIVKTQSLDHAIQCYEDGDIDPTDAYLW